jgi:hypothetical protein
MSDLNYLCPQCRAVLKGVTKGDFDTWECSAGHGVGVTLTEAYNHLQEDEIHAIWQAAKTAPPSSLRSPVLGQPMVAVTVTVDDDEIEGNQGPGAHLVTLDVAPDEQFLWFHVVDLAAMPADLPNPLPSAEEFAKLAKLRDEAAASVARDADAAESAESKLAYRFGSRAAALLGLTGLTNRLGARAKKRLADK